MKNQISQLVNGIDGAIYALIGPFAALYVFPQFFMQIEKNLFGAMNIPVPAALDFTGSGLMWAGAALAIWCGVLMAMNKWGSVVPFFKPTALVTSGPYQLVRHPMMWALFLVLIGEVLVFLSPAVLLWFIIWVRFTHIYITRHEEPFLLRHFGDDYKNYSAQVPRLVPFTNPVASKNEN